MSNGNNLHVAVLAFPFGTHAPPLLSMVRRIAMEFPNATFSFLSTSRSNATLFSGEVLFPNVKPYNVNDGLPEGYVPSRNPIESIWLFIKAMPDNFKRVIDEAVAETGKKITCLLTDAFYWFGADLAVELNVKWIPVWTAGPHSLITHVYTDLIRENICIKDVHAVQSMNFLPGFPELKASDLPEGVIDDIKSPFAMMLYKMGQELPKATAVCINSFAKLHTHSEKELESKFKSLLNIGPFILTTPQPKISDEHGCLEWLDKHEKASVVYICFGSAIIPPPYELAALSEALEESGFPFIWACRGDQRQLPKGFLERTRNKGKVVAWAPQMEILKHSSVGVCLTHSGWNSVLECIVGGVPMISRPFFGDQKLNARMLESGVWDIGVGVENGVLTKEATLKALKLILSSEKGKIMKQKIVKLRESALEAIGPNGTSARNFTTLIKIITS